MQKQKTVAKWLAILLLCTVAVGSYLLYGALTKEGAQVSSGSAGETAASGLDDGENDQSGDDKPAEEQPAPLYHTELPRAAEKIAGVTVSHVGGEGDDVVHKAVTYGSRTLIFFRSDSKEYDLHAAGLSVAVFDEDVLLSVNTFSDLEFSDCKLTTNGVCLIARNDDFSKLFLFDGNGEIKAENSFPMHTSLKLYLNGRSLVAFYVADGYLREAQILSDTSLSVSAFKVGEQGKVKEVLASSGKYMVVCEKDECVSGYSFEHENGFDNAFSHDKLAFSQILCVGGESGVSFVLLASAEGKPKLFAYDGDFKETARRTLEGCSVAAGFATADGLLLVGNGQSLKLCRHLDVIAAERNDYSFTEISAVLPVEYGAFLAKSEGGYSLISPRDFLQLAAFEDCTNPALFSCSNGVCFIFSSRDKDGLTRANFGASDVFSLFFPVDSGDESAD